MSIEVLNKSEIEEVSGGLSICIGEGTTSLLNLNLNLEGVFGVVGGVVTQVVGLVQSLLGGLLGGLKLC